MRADLFAPSSALGKPPAWRSRTVSFLIHIALVFVIVFPPFHSKVSEESKKKEMMVVELAPYKIVYYPVSSKPNGGGGGGGERNPIPATKGKLPRFSMQQLTPPMLPRNPNPRLPAEPTVIVPPDIKMTNPDLKNYGDPLAKLITDSQGPGSGGGFGTGSGGGVGSGSGPGVGPGSGGGTGGGVYQVGKGGASAPVRLYCPDPHHTEESRKANVKDAVVTLRIIVNDDGSVREAVEVVKKYGLGLDEEAVKAVRNWRFKPGEINGKPVAVYILVEVKFNIY